MSDNSCPTPTEEECFPVFSVDIGSSSDFFRSSLALPVTDFTCLYVVSCPLAWDMVGLEGERALLKHY